MNDDQFDKLFKYLQGEFTSVRQEIQDLKTELKADLSHVYELVDADLKRRETDEHERAAVTSQLDQHEDWIERASRALKIRYDRAA
jgi:hypothetical protein